jgi:glycosyltransferase 2 family protein
MRVSRAHVTAVAAAFVVSAVFAYLAAQDVHLDETWDALRSVTYWWLVPATAAMGVSVVMRAARWRILFEPGRRPALWPTTKATLLGYFFNNILPARAGEAVRIVALKYYADVSPAEATATVVVERLFDVLSLLLLLFVTSPWLPHISWLRSAAVLACVLLVILAIGIALVVKYGERPVRRLLDPFQRLPFFRDADLDQVAHNVTRGLSTLRRPGHGLYAFAWTVGSWLVLALSLWFLTLGFDLDLPMLAALLMTVAIGLAFIVPAAPAAVGVFEAAAIAAATAYDVPRPQALAYALVLHAVGFFPFVVAGFALLATLPRRGLLQSAERTS